LARQKHVRRAKNSGRRQVKLLGEREVFASRATGNPVEGAPNITLVTNGDVRIRRDIIPKGRLKKIATRNLKKFSFYLVFGYRVQFRKP